MKPELVVVVWVGIRRRWFFWRTVDVWTSVRTCLTARSVIEEAGAGFRKEYGYEPRKVWHQYVPREWLCRELGLQERVFPPVVQRGPRHDS